MASPSLLTPTSKPKPISLPRPKSITISTTTINSISNATTTFRQLGRREFAISMAGIASQLFILPASPATAASDEDYVKETEEVISKVRSTIIMDKKDPNIASAVAELREASNSWVAKYRREKALLGRVSFRDMYSALNAVSGHYISFGPTAPIPAKRKDRILEEVETAEKALKRGR